MDPVFEPLPDDLASLSDEDLQALLDERVALAQRLADGDAELIGERTAAQVIEEMEGGVGQIESLRSEQTERETARTEVADEIATLAARIGLNVPVAQADDEDEADGDAEEDDADADEEPAAEAVEEPILAAAPASRNRPFIARPPARHEPEAREDTRRREVILASSDIPGYAAGSEMRGLSDVAKAIVARRRGFQQTPPGMREDIVVARIERPYDESETLISGQDEANWEKIEAKVGQRALAASGGLCAPVTPYYDLLQLSTDARPVRDSLPRFNAARGGIKFMVPPGISAITTGVGTMTAANDAIGGTTATKTCQHITCPSPVEVDVDMIYHCLEFGNLGSRTWPEQVENFTQLAMAAQASVADTKLLDAMSTHSTAVTVTSQMGYVSSLLGDIITAATAYRSRHRMDPMATLRVMMPAWAKDGLVVDLLRSAFTRFSPDANGLIAFMRSQNIAITFYIDTVTGAGQVFGAQSAGAMLAFPTTCVWFLFAEGSFLWLDNGTLDLGIVRDSVLNATNDYSVFGETFENLAFIGLESLKVTSTVQPDGTTAAPVTISHPTV